MRSRTVFFVLASLTVILLLGMIGVGYGADQLLTKEAKVLSDLKAESQAKEQNKANLLRGKADLEKYAELNNIAKVIVPQDKDQTQTVREIVKISEESGIPKLSSVTFDSSTLGLTGARGRSSAGTPLTQVQAVPGMKGVYSLPIRVTVSPEDKVPYQNVINFLRGLENNRRTAQVTSLSFRPDDKTPNLVSFTLVINEYIKP